MTQRAERILNTLLLLSFIAWGAYVTLIYLGTEGHISIFMSQDAWRALGQKFPSAPGTLLPTFQRGLHGLQPFLEFFLSQLKPFMAYAMLSLLLYGAFAAVRVLKTGKLFLDLVLSPLRIFLIALLSLWLLSTTLFYATIPGLEQRMLIEPSAEVYTGVGEEGLAVLQGNFQTLLKRGCLAEDPLRRSRGGTRVFAYRGWCVQVSFITRIFSQVGMLLFLLLNFLVIGSTALKVLRCRIQSRFLEFLMSLGLGACGLMLLLWVLALFHVIGPLSVWTLLIAIPLLGYRFTWEWLHASHRECWRYQGSFFSLSLLLFFLLVSILTFNFLTVVRPFPIGWDDLGKYVNLPRQLSSYGQIIPGVLAIQWEYLTAIGFLLFGTFSTFGSVFAMQINWMAGLLAVLAIYGCARLLLGSRAGLFAALFYYSLPMVGHFSFADMKTENALFALGVMGLLAIFAYLYGSRGDDVDQPPVNADQRDWRWLLIAGIFFAAAFGTKPTIILLFLMGGVILTGGILGSLSGIGAALFSLAVLSALGGLSLSEIMRKIGVVTIDAIQPIATVTFAVLGIVFLLLPPLQRYRRGNGHMLHLLRSYFLGVAFLSLGFFGYAAPWIIHNMFLSGRVAIAAALTAPNHLTPWITYTQGELTPDAPPGSRGLPEELKVDLQNEHCIGTAREEELDRYWGFGSGPMHYLGLPWRVVMNSDSQGYYLMTSPLLLFFPLLLLLPSFWRSRPLRLLFLGTSLYLLEWIFLGSGIPWYGIGMFLGFALCIEALMIHQRHRPLQIAAGIVTFFAFAFSFSARLWQFDLQKNLYEYAWGKASAVLLQEMTIPDYDDIAEHVMRLSQNPDRPFLYRMGTFISYFIPRNLTIITQNDNQLGFFNCLNQEQDHALTLRRLKALGFHSIVFDTNTDTIERDPNGTLHQKVQRFLQFANDASLGIISVVNNPSGGVAYMILP